MRVLVSSKEMTYSDLEIDDVTLCTTVRNMIYSGHTELLGEEKRGKDWGIMGERSLRLFLDEHWKNQATFTFPAQLKHSLKLKVGIPVTITQQGPATHTLNLRKLWGRLRGVQNRQELVDSPHHQVPGNRNSGEAQRGRGGSLVGVWPPKSIVRHLWRQSTRQSSTEGLNRVRVDKERHFQP